MSYSLRDEFQPTRSDWSEYSFHHRPTNMSLYTTNSINSLIKKVILHNPRFPTIKCGDSVVTKFAVVVNSNNGLKGSSGLEKSNVLAGPNLKQIVYNLNENGTWSPVNNNNVIDYPSDSTIFSLRLRMYDPHRGIFSNIPKNPSHKWEITVQIV